MSATRTAVLLLALPVVALGQESVNPSAPKAWTPNYETAISEVSAAERAEMIATAKAIEAIFRRVPELADPQRSSPRCRRRSGRRQQRLENGGQLVAAGEPTGHRLLTPDPAFWRVRRSRAETRTITVRFNLYVTCQTDPVRAALERAWQTLDWAALKRLVDSP
jgi:hypothetical protein